MDYQKMTIDQLDALLEDLDGERQALRERARQIMDARNQKIAADNAAEHGMTVEDYAEAKAKAAENNEDMTTTLRNFRKATTLQIARAGVASIQGRVVK